MEEYEGKVGWKHFHELKNTFVGFQAWAKGEVDKISIILTGLDGSNGLRGELNDLRKRTLRNEGDIMEKEREISDKLNALEAWGKEQINHYWHEQRPIHCIGKNLLEDHEKETETKMEALSKAIDGLNERLVTMDDNRRKERAQVAVAALAVFSSVVVAAMSAYGAIQAAKIANAPESSYSANPMTGTTSYQFGESR